MSLSKANEQLETEELKLRFLEAKKRLASHLRQLGKELEAEFSDTVDKASSRLEQGVERVSSNVAQAVTQTVSSVGDSIDETVDRLKERLDIRGAIQTHPWRNLGLSVATGLGVALLFGSRRRPALAEPAAPLTARNAGTTSFFAGLMAPAVIQLARTGAGYLLESFVETSVRRAHEGLEARSPRYARAAEAVRQHAGLTNDMH